MPVGLIPSEIRSDLFLLSARRFGSGPDELAVKVGASPSPMGLIPCWFLGGNALDESVCV
jgi:hypothetical protein